MGVASAPTAGSSTASCWTRPAPASARSAVAPKRAGRKQPSDLAGLTALQHELLEAAIQALAPGGMLAYVTCSPHLDETRKAIAGALSGHPDIALMDTRAVLARIATRDLDLAPGSHAQLWPHRHGTDAMFIQLMTKAADRQG